MGSSIACQAFPSDSWHGCLTGCMPACTTYTPRSTTSVCRATCAAPPHLVALVSHAVPQSVVQLKGQPLVHVDGQAGG